MIINPHQQNQISEQVDLSADIIAGNQEHGIIDRKPSSPIDPVFIEYANTRDIKLRNKILEQNEALITYTLNKYYANKLDGDSSKRQELYQEGMIGLISAIEGFKPEYGFQFSTYAVWWVRQAMNNYLLNVDPLIHVPAHIRAANTKALKIMSNENKEIGELLEIYKEAKYSKKLISSIQAAVKTKLIVSLSEPAHVSRDNGAESGMTLGDTICADDEGHGPESTTESKYFATIAKKAFARLKNKDKFVLLLRFDAIDHVPKKFHVQSRKERKAKI
jgi:RNA polymerase sigma factor (sigma-70 family)